MADTSPELAIFHTFKTNAGQLTGEARRQRAIIALLASNTAPIENTRTAIAQSIAEKNKVPWKNIYSGIFRDFDEILMPLGIVSEEGRLPLKRGPKALQEKGVPFYRLTERGVIVALAFDSAARGKALKRFLKETTYKGSMIAELSRIAPKLVYTIFEDYVQGYCGGKIGELTPFSSDKVRRTRGRFIENYKELLDGFVKLSKTDRDGFCKILDEMV